MLPAAEPRPGPYHNIVGSGKMNKVPHDQEVIHIAHVVDYTQLVGQAFLQGSVIIWVTLRHAVLAQLIQIAPGIVFPPAPRTSAAWSRQTRSPRCSAPRSYGCYRWLPGRMGNSARISSSDFTVVLAARRNAYGSSSDTFLPVWIHSRMS